MPDARNLKIGDDTMRFYEREGLLGRVRRTSGIRRYDEAVVRRIELELPIEATTVRKPCKRA